MKDQILLVEQDNEAAKLGWTCLGPVDYEHAWQNTAWVWCKEGTFVLLYDRGNGTCGFIEFVERKEAIRMQYERRLSEEEAQRKKSEGSETMKKEMTKDTFT